MLYSEVNKMRARSIAEYIGQKPIELLVRLMRTGIGCLIVAISLLLYDPNLMLLFIPAIAISAFAGFFLAKSSARIVDLQLKEK
jgi:hypothetical protein